MVLSQRFSSRQIESPDASDNSLSAEHLAVAQDIAKVTAVQALSSKSHIEAAKAEIEAEDSRLRSQLGLPNKSRAADPQPPREALVYDDVSMPNRQMVAKAEHIRRLLRDNFVPFGYETRREWAPKGMFPLLFGDYTYQST